MEAPMEHLIAAAMPTFPGLQGVELVGQQVTIGPGRPDLLGRKNLRKGRTRWFIIVTRRTPAPSSRPTGSLLRDALERGRCVSTSRPGTTKRIEHRRGRPPPSCALTSESRQSGFHRSCSNANA
jgi:hypothetical protein